MFAGRVVSPKKKVVELKMKRNLSRDYGQEGQDPLLDDQSSSVNVELTKEETKHMNQNVTSSQYGATANTKDLVIDEEFENSEIIKTMMNEFGNEYNKTQKSATIFSSSVNLSNTVIGAGILGIPSATRNSGYIMGIFLFAFISIIAAYTMHLSMCVALCVEYSSYDALCKITIPKMKKVADLIVGFATWGVLVAYFVVIGDSMDLAMIEFLSDTNKRVIIFGWNSYDFWIDRYFWMVLYLIIFIIPTISLKKMDSLRFTSFFALFIFIVLMIMVILYWLVDDFDACGNDQRDDEVVDVCNDGITAFPTDWAEFVKTASIFIFAYECHSNLWPIRNELKVPTVTRLTKVSINTVIFCTVIYAVIGYAGYLTYGVNVDGNIINNYPQSRLVGIIRVGLAFAITFSFPVALYPARECFATLFFNKKPEELKWYTFYGMTYTMAILGIITAIIVDDLEIVLAVIGDIGGTAIVFVFPALFYWRLGDHELLSQSPYHEFKKQSCKVLVVVGIVLGISGLVLQFTDE